MRERLKEELSEFITEQVLLPMVQNGYRESFPEMILLNKAYVIMQAETGMMDQESCETLLAGLDAVYRDLKPEDLSGKKEDIYFNVEQALLEKVGKKAGGKLHAGRSRNDLSLTLNRMYVRRTIWSVLDALLTLQKTLLITAEANLDTVMTGYTHIQPAQPTTFGHYCTALFNVLARDFTRIREAYAVVNRSPYGAAAFAGTGFPVDRDRLAKLLGFDGLVENTLDSVASRDYLIQVEMAYTLMMLNISRFAEDMDIWASYEFDLLKLGGETAICSSIMPQKKNPIAIELARAKAGHAVGALVSAMTMLKGTPFSIHLDQFDSAASYCGEVDQVLQGVGLLNEVLLHSHINKEGALEKARHNLCTVTALADELVRRFGITFGEAHAIVGHIVAVITEQNQGTDAITPELLREAAQEVAGTDLFLDAEALHKILDPRENVNSKVTPGGPNAASVRNMIEEGKRRFTAEQAWLAAAQKQVQDAYAQIGRPVC